MCGRWLWVIGILALVTAGTADAKPKGKAKGKAKPQVVALFPLLQQNDPDEATVTAVEALVEKASTLVEGVSVVAGKKLKTKVKGDPAKLIAKCGSDPVCFAKLGKKAGAKEVLLGRAAPRDGGGVRIQFLAIDVKSKSISRKIPLEFPSADEVKAVLRGSIYRLFGVEEPNAGSALVAAAEPPPAPTEPPKNDEDLLGTSGGATADGAEELPLTLALEAPTPAAAPVDVTPPAAPSSPAATPAPGAESPPAPSPESPATGAGEPQGLLAAAPPPSSEPGPPPPATSQGRGRILRWVGIGLAGVGVAAAGAGGYFGMHANSVGDSITSERPSQLEAIRRQDEANTSASRANMLMVGGGAAAAVGAILFGIDAMMPAPRLEVSVGGTSGVSLVLPW